MIQNSDFQIHAGWLIDGTGGPVRKNMLIHIENGYIRDIQPVTCYDVVLSATDLSECTVLPGLIDCHIHLGMSGTNDMSIRQRQLTASYQENREMMTIHARELLKFGVIAARDGGDSNAHTLRYASENQIPVVLKVAGKAWHKPGRYGALIGRPPMNDQTLAEAILNDSSNIHQVKIVQSGLNSLKHFGRQTEPQFSSDELKDAVIAAKSLGLSVMVHTNGDLPTRIAIEAGCDSIEHGFFMGEDNLKRMADKGIFWIPTACTMKGYAEQLPSDSVEVSVAHKNLEHQLEQIAKARELGVRIGTGTDAGCLGVFHGAAMIEELKLLIKAGFSISGAIRCAALNGANLLRLPDTGAILPGMKATLIAVRGNPSMLPESLGTIEKLFISDEAEVGNPAY